MASQPTAWTKTTLWYIGDERSVNGVEEEVDDGVEEEVDELILSVGLEEAVDHIRGGDDCGRTVVAAAASSAAEEGEVVVVLNGVTRGPLLLLLLLLGLEAELCGKRNDSDFLYVVDIRFLS